MTIWRNKDLKVHKLSGTLQSAHQAVCSSFSVGWFNIAQTNPAQVRSLDSVLEDFIRAAWLNLSVVPESEWFQSAIKPDSFYGEFLKHTGTTFHLHLDICRHLMHLKKTISINQINVFLSFLLFINYDSSKDNTFLFSDLHYGKHPRLFKIIKQTLKTHFLLWIAQISCHLATRRCWKLSLVRLASLYHGRVLGQRSMAYAQPSLMTFWTYVQGFNHNYSMQLNISQLLLFWQGLQTPRDQVYHWFRIGFYK